MKTIKIKFVGFWDSFIPTDSQIYKLLSKHYDVNICDNPDYVICGCFGKPYEYLKYSQVRIMVCGENYIPDFNFIDYAISRYPINFLDRSFYEPGCIKPFPDSLAINDCKKYTLDDLHDKEYFCNFISSHESEYGIRGDFFKKLSEYKKVLSAGSYLNNSQQKVNRFDGTKSKLQKRCKFSLCFESTKNEGFITEKITEAFLNGTIPIYYGSDTIKQIFNPDSFINISDFNSFEDAINRIIEIDKNDDLYLKMLNAQKLKDKNYFDSIIENEEKFLVHIFEQPLQKAYRRSRVYTPINLEKFIIKQSAKKKTRFSRFFKHK